ncbi:hypothetical protein Q8G48_29075, partial [Klebsiella pneumoniae]|uniref:hypothetical protein n=1 Tax=Klebsiella pneumoniae TaxID=573 RepID=UPI003013D1AA
TVYVLAGENELTNLAKEVPALQRAVFDSARVLAEAEQFDAQRKEEIDLCTRQQAILAAQLTATTSVQEHNKIVIQS